MKYLRFFFILSMICIVQATYGQNKKFSPEEYICKQQAYITDKAELTKEEAARFFPLYQELQERKRDLHHQNKQLYKKGFDAQTNEQEYAKIVEDILDNNIEAEKLERFYLKKYQQFLTSKKIFAIQRAEFRFNREILKRLSTRSPQPHK